MDRLFLQGRVLAETYDRAIEMVIKKIIEKGFAPVKTPRPYPCPVQPVKGMIWWEYQTEVKEL